MEAQAAGLANLADTALVREGLLLLGHWVYLVPVAGVLLAMGGVGRGLGLPSLFRDDAQIFDPEASWGSPATPRPPRGLYRYAPPVLYRAFASPALWSGFGFVATVGLFWMAVHTGPSDWCRARGASAPCPTELFDAHRTRAFWLLALVLALAACVVVLVARSELRRPRADFTRRRTEAIAAELRRTAAGTAFGAAFALAAYAVGAVALAASEARAPGVFAFMALPYVALCAVVNMRRSALPCLSIHCLIIGLILIGGLFPEAWHDATPLVVIGAALWIAHANGAWDKHTLPGFEPLYPLAINPQANAPGEDRSMLVEPIRPLEAWRAARPEAPILVLVATSGGAYRAAFWTSLLLDRLVAGSGADGRWPGLARDVRLVTGASGGMVAGAYFVAMAAEGPQALASGITARIGEDTRARMAAADGCDRNQPIARDSLSPVAHQLARRDLPQLVWPGRPATDRGRVLDTQWPTLGVPFARFRDAEAAGEVPSILLSPMLVETGALALFSNLDLRAIRRRALPRDHGPEAENRASVEVFAAFPGTHASVSLATAVRLNASFPYISPAITLPTYPGRRPADAGYYDNYGIDLATAWLEDDGLAAWIAANCAGVAVLQIRAFPSETPTAEASPAARAYQFLSSPVEGLFSARKASQMFRNDQQLALAKARYDAVAGRDFLRIFTFEANTDVSMSWYLRCDELRALDGLLRPVTRDDLTWELPSLDAFATRPGAPQVGVAEVEDWVKSNPRFARGRDDVVAGLQRGDLDARWAQYLHHRAKIAREFDLLERFWQEPEVADTRAVEV